MPSLRDIVGHKKQIEELTVDIASGNIAHAYLFSGPRHLGKMTTAFWFACELLTQGCSPEEKEKACRDIERLTHSDLLVLDELWIEDMNEDWNRIGKFSNIPQQHRSKTPKARTNAISIDDVRALQARLYETGIGKWRCCIIRSIERMPPPSANAFLKILEEPPPGLVFILTTEARTSLLPTIISRTRTVRFERLAPKELRPFLLNMEEDDVRFITHLSQGAPGIVVELRSDPEKLRAQRLVHTKAASVWEAATLGKRLELLAPLREKGGVAQDFLLHLSLTLREGNPVSPPRVQALSRLIQGMQTNVYKPLLVEQFALSIG